MFIAGRRSYARETYPEPNIGAGAAAAILARAWSQSGAVTLSSAGALNLATVSVTPLVTGKFRVIVTGRADDQSGSQNGLLLYVGHGAGDPVPTSDYSPTASSSVNLDANKEANFSIVVDLDAVGTVFPVGVAVTIGVAGQTTAGAASVPSSGLQIEVQEVF